MVLNPEFSIHLWFKENAGLGWMFAFAMLLGAIGGATCRIGVPLGWFTEAQCAFQ